ncbi:MAG: DUF362 domain-containing protein [Planctomycetota bacterium]|nr:DUF362 domain-containing protein [Planctomycetota bacterium]MDI6786770.1 DUF362 domain-containing protein [Planctomycetota bacterium]
MNKIERRRFLKALIISGAGLFIIPSKFITHLSAAPPKVKVVVVKNPAIRDSKDVINKAEVKRTLYEALSVLSASGSAEELLQKLVSPKDTVGIKVNTYLGEKDNATKPEVAYSIAELLIKIEVKENNIIIWDRAGNELEESGYKINDSKKGIRCIATNTHRVQRLSKPMAGFDEIPVNVGETQTRISNIVKMCQVIVNTPALKTFKFREYLGISGSILNMYGALEITDENAKVLYAQDCNPGAAESFSISAIKNKTKLVVCDAIYPLYNGGPSDDPRYHWGYNGIIAGFDPVAVDIVGQRIIQKYRDKVLPDTPKLRSDYLDTCAGGKYRLGTANLKEIEIVERTI